MDWAVLDFFGRTFWFYWFVGGFALSALGALLHALDARPRQESRSKFLVKCSGQLSAIVIFWHFFGS